MLDKNQYPNLNKKQRIRLQRMFNAYEDINYIINNKPVRCENCKFYIPEDCEFDGVTLKQCRIGSFNKCPFKERINKLKAIKNIEYEILKCENLLIEDKAFIKTKWLADKDWCGNWCLGCKHDNEKDIEICNHCTYRSRFEEEELKNE